jgi:phenylalanine-4-hydroxylase
LHHYYNQIRKTRNGGASVSELSAIFDNIKSDYPGEWLLPMEMLEITAKEGTNESLSKDLTSYLKSLKDHNPELENLVTRGLNMLEKNIL